MRTTKYYDHKDWEIEMEVFQGKDQLSIQINEPETGTIEITLDKNTVALLVDDLCRLKEVLD